MKFVKLSLMVLMVCLVHNSFAMEKEKDTEQIVKTLSHAQLLSDKVHQILGDRWYMSCWADFKTDEALALFKKNEMNKALDHANEARPLLLGILENKKADA